MRVNLISALILLLSMGLVWSRSYSQNIRTTRIVFEIPSISLKEALAKLEKETGLSVFYPTELVENHLITEVPYSRRTIAATLDILLRNRSEEHTSELQSRENLVCRLLLEKKNKNK